MGKRVIETNSWVTGRYLKESDIKEYFENLDYIKKIGKKINPIIYVSAPTGTRKTPDIFFETGVDVKKVEKNYKGDKIFRSYYYSKEKYKTYVLIDSAEILLAYMNRDVQSLYNKIANHCVSITDDNIELRHIR